MQDRCVRLRALVGGVEHKQGVGDHGDRGEHNGYSSSFAVNEVRALSLDKQIRECSALVPRAPRNLDIASLAFTDTVATISNSERAPADWQSIYYKWDEHPVTT